jgi:hypothetical protein
MYTAMTEFISRAEGSFGLQVHCSLGCLLLGSSVIYVYFIICMLTLLLMSLAGLHFCVGSDFVTPSL